MRLLLPLLLCLALTACDDDEGPVNRIVTPAPIAFATPASTDLTEFRQAYILKDQPAALFFLGTAKAMTAHFIDENGLVSVDRILSREQQRKLDSNNPRRGESDKANSVLGDYSLPDRSFAVLPAQDGYVLHYRYGTLDYVSYMTHGQDNALKIGSAADLGLLAKLLDSAGAKDSFESLPFIFSGVGADRRARLLLFNSAPDALGTAILDNAAALFRPVRQDGNGWDVSPLPAPTSTSDKGAIEAIRAMLVKRKAEQDSSKT